MPNVPETFVHRIGRTARAGNKGAAYSFCSADEKRYVKSIQQLINLQLDVIDDHPYPLDPKAKAIVHKSKTPKTTADILFPNDAILYVFTTPSADSIDGII